MKKFLCISVFALTLFICTQNTTLAATSTTTLESTYYNPATVEAKVRAYFADIPEMIEIARCESKFRQYTDAGNVLRGGSGGGMVGVFQFFESIHAAAALTLGYNISTLEGNLSYARHIYESQGTTPWNSAKSCWNIPTVSSSTQTLISSNGNVDNKMLEQKVALLLKLIELLKQLKGLT